MTPDVLIRRAAAEAKHGRPRRDVTLEDRYTLQEGTVYLSGVQALVRAMLDVRRADEAAGLRTGAMVSGYQGSPLGTLDKELARITGVLEPLAVHVQPGVNEELAATTVWGSQLAPALPRSTVEGVTGWWYGKAPGVDRAGDAFRHGGFVGAHPKGGMVALCGDDPSAKSSTLPSAVEATLRALHMPVLFPGDVQETLDLGRHAVALSRASGLWTGLKVVTAVADATATAQVGPQRVRPVLPMVEWEGGPYVHVPSASLLPPASLEMERTLAGPRLALAREYGRRNDLNRVTRDSPDARLGLVATGTAYHDLVEALRTLGLDDDRAFARAGLRIIQLQLPWPLHPDDVRELAAGLDELLVIEEKGPFVATGLREALYDAPQRPRVHADGVPVTGALDPDSIARAVGGALRAAGARLDGVEARLGLLEAIDPRGVEDQPARTPFFCSGCPHNRSTAAPDDAAVGLGIGCHTMVLLNQAGKGRVTGLTQMGGEGAQWIGQAPFTATEHLFQNLGDGTFHHSGSLAVRAAVAAGVNVTYKLLYNRAVAMTGGQAVEGGMTVPQLTRWLALEGVRRIVVTSDEPEKYHGVTLDPIAEVRDRDALLAAQRELAREPGVTVLIHDQQCATELRRDRKRGRAPEITTRIAINERVCEGCGDCGQKSGCLSVQPVDTDFGRKTRIHQASCNLDRSCVDGDCPSFLEIIPGKRAKPTAPLPPAALPEPQLRRRDATLRLIGIGGTGVVTIAQVVGMAALMDGRHVRGLDQTGLAQKGGPVISDVRIEDVPTGGSTRATTGGVDAYLGFDLLGATAPENLLTADPGRTVAVVSTHRTPTGAMVVDPAVGFAELDASLDVIGRHVAETVVLDPQALSETLFGDHMPANALLLGAAWQAGLVPVTRASLEAAFRLNGAAVEQTLAAFDWGRAVVADPDAVAAATAPPVDPAPAPAAEVRAIVESVGAPADSELERLLLVRVSELVAYQDAAYARRYAAVVADVRAAEPGSGTRLAEAVARGLHKLLAYKDEYEVARLHLDPVERARLEAEFGAGARVSYKLHPPLLRTLGMERKVGLGPWFDPAFRGLVRLRRLRGTRLDPFGRAHVRRVERQLPVTYEALIRRGLEHLGEPGAYETVLALAELPDGIRGYEDIKLRNVAAFEQQAQALLERLEPPQDA